MKGSKSPYENMNPTPSANSNYDYMADVKSMEIKDLKTSSDSVPTWSVSDMNEANAKTK